jgi:hypothetical protein
MGCGGRGSVVARGDRRAGLTICERLSHAQGGIWLVEAMMKVAADGKTVWSWHPLLVSSRREERGISR